MLSDFIVLIGARGGSKRVVNKNLRYIGGIPLLAHTIKTGRQLTHDTYVSTDSPEIGLVAKYYKAELRMRGEGCSHDTSTDYDWIIDFLDSYQKREGKHPKYIVFLRPTTPLRDFKEVKLALHVFDKDRDSLRSVEAIPEAVEKMFKLGASNELIPAYPGININDTNNANQTFPITYKANGYVDILKTEVILNTKSLYGSNIQGLITPVTIEIDTEEDLERAEYEICKDCNEITP